MSIEKIKAVAKEKYGKDISDTQAAKYVEQYGKLDDDELDNVAGGCDFSKQCPECGTDMKAGETNGLNSWSCPNCDYWERT